MNKGDQIQVRVEKLIRGGQGLARHEGQVIFISGAAPEDELIVEIVTAKKNFATAKIIKILSPSSHRQEPPCVHFGRCGGCHWQHVSYPAQVVAKQGILNDVVRQFFKGNPLSLEEMIESPRILEYRNRIQVKARGGQVGFYGRGSHELVPIDRCAIAEPEINEALAQLAGSSPDDGSYRIQKNLDGTVSVTNIESLEEPLGFAQINETQNQILKDLILALTEGISCSGFYDLYGGYGNFARPLAQKHPERPVTSVEWSRQGTQAGIAFATQNGLRNLRFVNADVKDYLVRIQIPKDSFVIIDPPREGCDRNVIKSLAQQTPKVLVYISCDPMTWGRDCQLFLQEATRLGLHYRIATIRGLDMFPQTDHIEVFSVIERVE